MRKFPARKLAMAFLAFLASSVVGTARATVMVEIPLEDLIRDADAIVHGTVEQVGVRLVLDERGATPHTLTRLRVHEWLKGGSGQWVAIDEIGGVMPEGGLRIDGTPDYRRGEEVVVFLRQIGRGLYRTYGMAQGRFEVIHGVPGVDDSIERDTSALAFASWANGPMTVGHGGRRGMRLVDFLGYVRSVIAQLALWGDSGVGRRLR
jgi:hypothetical protein